MRAKIMLTLFVMCALVHRTLATTCTQAQSSPCAKAHWTFAGPGGWQDANDPNRIISASATNIVVQAPKGGWLAGTVNGGIWRTLDTSMSAHPHWVNVLDGQNITCTSIVTIHVSKFSQTVYAGCGGSTSSEQGYDWNVLNNGDWGGVMMSTDGGDTWKMTNFPENYFVTSILDMGSYLLVATRSRFTDPNDGGIFTQQTAQLQQSGAAWKRVFFFPVFNLEYVAATETVLAASPFSAATVYGSQRGGPFEPLGTGLSWAGKNPFYPCLASYGSLVFVGALTVDPNIPTSTNSAIFWRDLQSPGTEWKLVSGQPQSMDQDQMPKDRMALLVNPTNSSQLFVAGNAGSVQYRVDWAQGEWTDMTSKNESLDGSAPHVDCRNWAWDPENSVLLLVSDGGVFVRDKPSTPGGRWRSLNGDMGAMEFLSAFWDSSAKRWIAAAQDNCVQLSANGAVPTASSMCVADGDGTVAAVDNTPGHPSRLFGCTQFLGTSDDKIHSQRRVRRKNKRNSVRDDDTDGMAMIEGNRRIGIPLPDLGFSDMLSSFPFFVQHFTLNTMDRTQMLFWANGTAGRPTGLFRVEIPRGLNHSSQFRNATLLAEMPGTALDFIWGGFVNGKADPNVIVAINNTHLHFRDSSSSSWELPKAFPYPLAAPLDFGYDTNGDPVVGPVSHGRTVTLAVSPRNAYVIAVTGWSSIRDNMGTESVWLTVDKGQSWIDVTGDLVVSTGTIGKARPSGMLFLDVAQRKDTALLVGTTRGVYYTWLSNGNHVWNRLGDCEVFPIVMAMGLSYESTDDTLVCATMGRGVYIIPSVTKLLTSC